jgi:hypothetical protein
MTTDYALKALLSQIVIGHRAWLVAAGGQERFIPLHELRFYFNSNERTVWLTIVVMEEDLKRFSISHNTALARSGLSASFREVQWSEEVNGKRLFAFEQSNPISYAGPSL